LQFNFKQALFELSLGRKQVTAIYRVVKKVIWGGVFY